MQETIDAVLELREGMRWVFVVGRNLHACAGMDSDGDAAKGTALEHGQGQGDTIVPCDGMSAV